MPRNNLSISTMNLSDLNLIKDILETEFDDFWNFNIFKSEIENPNSIYFICKLDDIIVGFIGILVVLDEADITNIVVRKNYRHMRYFQCPYGFYNTVL